jgi:hypothetical protein
MTDEHIREARAATRSKSTMIWEATQAIIAVLVVMSTVGTVWMLVVVKGNYVESALQLISNAFFLVIGFYFGRTNEQRNGGSKPDGSK